MSDLDKINVTITSELKGRMECDAKNFEIYKKNNRDINLNAFVNRLLYGYHDSFRQESERKAEIIKELVAKYNKLKPSEINSISNELLKVMIIPIEEDSKRKGVTLPIKPTKLTEGIFTKIVNEIMPFGLSSYLRDIFYCYFRKPMFEREKIIFSKTYEEINDRCKNQQPISFFLRGDNKHLHQVIPFKITADDDGMFNYLICVEINLSSNKHEVKSFRLSRIENCSIHYSSYSMTDEECEMCRRTAKESPKYAINSTEEICVKFSDYGERLYNTRIYYDRPKYSRRVDEEGKHYYYFNCSADQAYRYFKRFEKGDALIVSPESLRKRIIQFHDNALSAYKKSDNGTKIN